MNDTIQPEKLHLKSLDIATEKRDELRRALAATFPEVITEDRIDLDHLKRVLGEWVEPDRERFGLNWPGKAACMRIIQAPTGATLRPCPELSIEWDKTRNAFIEGDNLEALKLMQKAYFGKVRMIYIDPPYNTGKEFIYPDKYSETLETYLEYSGQADVSGRKFSTNTDASGRFHSRWLNMMYPRLYLARNLLAEEGYICVSIGEDELGNLRSLMNIIFGEENFVNCVSVLAKVGAGASGGGEDKKLKKNIEYILIYCKNSDAFPSVAHMYSKRPLVDVIKEMREAGESWKYTSIIKNWGEKEFFGETLDGEGNSIRIWRRIGVERTTIRAVMKDEKLSEAEAYRKYFKGIFSDTNAQTSIRTRVIEKVGSLDDGDMLEVRYVPRSGRDKGREVVHYYVSNTVRRVIWLSDVAEDDGNDIMKKEKVGTLWDDFDYNNLGKEGDTPFPSGKKPVSLIKRCLEMANAKSGLCLDFFAGSGSTGHAVAEFNREFSAEWSCISIQLPEPIDPNSDDNEQLLKYCSDSGIAKVISAVGIERLRRVYKAASAASLSGPVDLGLRVFRLGRSCFAEWPGHSAAEDDGKLMKDLEAHVNHLDPRATSEDILWELLLKSGFPLAAIVNQKTLLDKVVYSVDMDALIICLDRELTPELIDSLAAMEPSRLICLDAGFKGNDQLKANAMQTFKARARNRETAIEFRTV